MKYVVILGDGMADLPLKELDNKTPLQCARKPTIDKLARKSIVGMVKTVPDGIAPGSDVANLSVMGYNPKQYYTGRSPLEAVSIGIELSDTDIAFRCNLVTLSDEDIYCDKTMLDYSADEISSEESSGLIDEINKHFKTNEIEFFSGISYRHCMVWHNGLQGLNLTPPHDISDKKINDYLLSNNLPKNDLIYDMMSKSYNILRHHHINLKRIERGLKPANSIWLWGEGKKPSISDFYKKYKLKGSVISAVDLIKGLGICAGLSSINVEGATGNIDTNFEGKGKAAINELLNNNKDFVYVHIEAPDECGHRREIENKVKAIELIDEKVVAPIIKALDESKEDYSILIMPDHPTPLALKTHTSDPVPFIIYRSNSIIDSKVKGYDEQQANSTGVYISKGYTLMDKFLNCDETK